MAKNSNQREPDKAARAEISYDEAVKEAKEIIAKGEENQWRLAELAHQVETEHGKRKLQEFASAIGACPNTLKRHRTVYRAWKGGPAPSFLSFAIAQALAKHPNRFELIKENPKMTRAEARRLMRENSGKTETKGVADADPKPQEKFDGDRLSSGVVKANKATGLAQDVARLLDDPDHEVTPLQAARCREAAAEWTKTAELYEQRRQQQSPEEPTPEVLDAPALSPVKSESVH